MIDNAKDEETRIRIETAIKTPPAGLEDSRPDVLADVIADEMALFNKLQATQ